MEEKIYYNLIWAYVMLHWFRIGSTHTLLTPLDLVKCRLQVDSAKYKNLITGFRLTFKEDGTRGLAKGWAPTAFGYSAQVRQKREFGRRTLLYFWFVLRTAIGFVQIRFLRTVQSILHRFDWRRECILVPHWLVFGCICFSWILCRYCAQSVRSC